MKSKCIVGLLFATTTLAFHANLLAQEDLSLASILDIRVTTASKEEQKLSQATSVMSVITRAEIENSGARNIFELLKRVPGYFPTRQSTWPLITARGLNSDGNDHFLFLIDGHQQNSIIGQGYQQQDQLPLLDKVDHIEIIRGPGSVLWGSSAAIGIINVITKNDLPKDHSVSISHYGGDSLRSYNFMKDLSDGEKLYSSHLSFQVPNT